MNNTSRDARGELKWRRAIVPITVAVLLVACGAEGEDSVSDADTTLVARTAVTEDESTQSGAVTSVVESATSTTGPSDAEDEVGVTVRLNSSFHGMHTYLVMAQELGYFEDEGLEVTLEAGAGGGQAEQFVGSGSEEIGITSATNILLARAEGVPLVAFAMPEPVDPAGIFFLDDSGIQEPTDLIGQKVCYPQGSTGYDIVRAGLESSGIDTSEIQWTTVSSGAREQLLVSGECDAAQGFFNSQPLTMDAAGFPASAFSTADLGMNVYGIVLFTSEGFLASNAQTVSAFVNAAARGWEYVYTHPEESIDVLLEKHAPDRIREAELTKLGLIADEFRQYPDFSERWGAMTEDGWRKTAEELSSPFPKVSSVDTSKAFTPEAVSNASATEAFADLYGSTPGPG